ncbi:hypothetical protein SAMN04488122_1721 [Chitinophaga arvensicola]|uniref:Uncharacterized protein n=1 Tax=Chitinophaga arvensicola TaxID=29529 RepID=A0A1I0QTE3_9BACT|nr:hypothetical protein SAMN04488122_1721 [Chitinophaga arvensicola]
MGNKVYLSFSSFYTLLIRSSINKRKNHQEILLQIDLLRWAAKNSFSA